LRGKSLGDVNQSGIDTPAIEKKINQLENKIDQLDLKMQTHYRTPCQTPWHGPYQRRSHLASLTASCGDATHALDFPLCRHGSEGAAALPLPEKLLILSNCPLDCQNASSKQVHYPAQWQKPSQCILLGERVPFVQ